MIVDNKLYVTLSYILLSYFFGFYYHMFLF